MLRRPKHSTIEVVAPKDEDTDKEKPKYWGENMSQSHFVYHKSHMHWIGFSPDRQARNC